MRSALPHWTATYAKNSIQFNFGYFLAILDDKKSLDTIAHFKLYTKDFGRPNIKVNNDIVRKKYIQLDPE